MKLVEGKKELFSATSKIPLKAGLFARGSTVR